MFCFCLRFRGTLYFVSLLLTAALGIQTVISYEFPEENRWNLRQKLKQQLCVRCVLLFRFL